jgi:DNA-binding MarR family transcriptional regulator/ribosomal protein S18 acetylase RimI-like enzyme
MAISNLEERDQISAVREFNRFYTARLGLLRKRHLDGDFSLTEARILYEIGANPQQTASTLRNTLGLDAGYISRCLTLLTRRKLVRQAASKQDGRERLLTLSPSGVRAVAKLNEQSELQIQELLADLGLPDREVLLDSLSKVRSILSQAKEPSLRIVRVSKCSDQVLHLLQEYYDAIDVVVRDTLPAIQKIIDEPSSGVWLAYLEDKPVGCVLLRKMPSIPFAGECKRLYVQPAARGYRIADKLMDALEDFAQSRRLRWIYLDSHDGLKTAIALYRRRGYVPCECYNDNPQATVFLRKKIP